MCAALLKDIGRSEFGAKLTEVDGLTKDIDHTIAKLDKWSQDKILDTPISLAPGRTKIVYEPLGVALIIGPWNFPYYCTFGPLVAAIAAGNCCLLKPSEGAPETMFAMK